MSIMSEYSFTVLRYVHDITTGEFINIGVAIFSKEHRVTAIKCRKNYGRLYKAFHGVNKNHLRIMTRDIERQFEKVAYSLSSELQFEEYTNVKSIAYKVLPEDDSSLQWSPIGTGITATPIATLDKLFQRMVMRYEEQPSKERHSEVDIWRNFRRDLDARQVNIKLEEKTISSLYDDVSFQYTWKNGVIHCFEPVSFDLASADGIREKAHKWVGRLTGIQSSREPFKVYLLVGRPQENDLERAYEKALGILKMSPVPIEVFEETQSAEFAQLVKSKIEKHESQVH